MEKVERKKVVLRQCPICGGQVDPRTLTDEMVMMPAEMLASLQSRAERAEAMIERLIEAGNKLGTYFIGYTPRKKELLQREFWEAWRSAVSDWQSMTSHVTNPSDSQGIVTRNGGEG